MIKMVYTTPASIVLLLICLATRFAENTGKLHVTNMKVPDPFIFGSSTDLYCNYTWDQVEQHRHTRKIYSIKWYKENEEFFRYIPSEDPPIISFRKDGVFVDESRSSADVVHLRIVQWNTAGTYRCEVTADDFETASMSKFSEVVAVPAHNPYITGQKTRYSLGELVDLNCTANSSDPVADLFWYINSEAAPTELLVEYPRVREPSNLLSAILGLRFRIGSQHIKFGTVKVKCTAMLGDVYMKSNEISFEVKPPMNAPALESREKNGKNINRGLPEVEFPDQQISESDGYLLSNKDGRRRKNPVGDNLMYGSEFEKPSEPVGGFGSIFRTAASGGTHTQGLVSHLLIIFPVTVYVLQRILT